jgi:hypothetical protein
MAKRAILLLSLAIAVCTSYAEDPGPELILLRNGKPVSNPDGKPLEIDTSTADTVNVIKTTVSDGRLSIFDSVELSIPSSNVRYIVYHHYAIPYVDGKSQARVNLFRETEGNGAAWVVPFMVGGGVAIWQLMEFRDDDKTLEALALFGLRDKNLEQERRRHEVFGGVALGGGVLLAALMGRSKTIYKLPDGTVLSAMPNLREPGLLLSYTWADRHGYSGRSD